MLKTIFIFAYRIPIKLDSHQNISIILNLIKNAETNSTLQKVKWGGVKVMFYLLFYSPSFS